jgi:P-type Cu2+ transporter
LKKVRQRQSQRSHNHLAKMNTDFKKWFYVVLILTIPIVLLSTIMQNFMKFNWQFAGSQKIQRGKRKLVLPTAKMPSS